MRIENRFTAIALALAATLPMAAQAGQNGVVFTQVGVTGIGIGYAQSVAPDFAIRGQVSALPNVSGTGPVKFGSLGDTGQVNANLTWSAVQIVADWYPSKGNGFRVSGGLVINNSKLALDGTGKVGPQNVNINGEVKVSDGVAPYLGIGYSTRPKDAKGWGFMVDAGVAFQKPTASLTIPDPAQAALLEADRVKQLADMQDAINPLKAMPMLSIGVSYAF